MLTKPQIMPSESPLDTASADFCAACFFDWKPGRGQIAMLLASVVSSLPLPGKEISNKARACLALKLHGLWPFSHISPQFSPGTSTEQGVSGAWKKREQNKRTVSPLTGRPTSCI